MLSYIIILILFITCYNIYVQPLDTNTKNILFSVIAVIILVQIQYLRQNTQRNNENFTTGQTNAEAIATIASMYNKGVLHIPKLNVTGDMAVGGQLVVSKDIGTLANLNVNGLSTLSGVANHNGMKTDTLNVNGLSTLSGVANSNGMTTDSLQTKTMNFASSELSGVANSTGVATDSLQTKTMNFASSGNYPVGFSLYMYNERLRFYSPISKSYIDFAPSGNSMFTQWFNSDNKERAWK